MSLRSRFLKFCAQADAVIGKINGAPQPLHEIVQEDLDRSLKDAQRRHQDKTAVALMEAGARERVPTPEEEADEADLRRLIAQFERNPVDANGAPVWSDDDRKFLQSLKIEP
ncbi:MAG TPA: hypothetical protein VL625_13255 [Patescibacteria group bacterium]|jgi:hypothetical protein|nr:hypothetical protein [Patescibacteria group bacterium]